MPVDPKTPVRDLLKRKKASIKQAPLEKGAPSWDVIETLLWRDIEHGAVQGLPGYRTIRKLLMDSRFDR
jgi:hypothetical protein